MQLGKLTVDAPTAEAFFDEQMRANGFAYLPIAPAHVFRAAALPSDHRDPFDRMLIAQAFTEALVLVTRDDFRAYGLATIWWGPVACGNWPESPRKTRFATAFRRTSSRFERRASS